MSGPKCSEYSVKADLTELLTKIVMRECALRESLGFMQKLLRDIDNELSKTEISEFKSAELANLRTAVNGRFTEYKNIIETALEKKPDNTDISSRVDILVGQQKFAEASNLIQQANTEFLDSLSKRENEIENYLDNSKREYSEIIAKYIPPPAEDEIIETKKSGKISKEAVIEEAKKRRTEIMRERIEKMTVKYNALCAVKKREPFATEGFPVTKEYANEMELRIKRIQDELVKDREQAYVRETLDRLIRGMGHDIVGGRDYPDRKKPEVYRSELYRYGGSSAIKTSFSANGEVLMEIVGLSETDRAPSDTETAMLCNEMERFCTEFKGLKQKLKSMGVYFNKIYEKPAEEQYACIDNINGYDLEAGVSRANLLTDTGAQNAAETLQKRYLDYN